jgi:hypothetical protein
VNFSSLEGTTQESRDFSHERFKDSNKGEDRIRMVEKVKEEELLQIYNRELAGSYQNER